MKRSLYSILFVILLAFTTVFFVSCNGGQTGDGDKSVPENIVLPDIEMAGGYTASITDGSARTAVCYTQGEGSPLTVIVTRTDKTGSEVAVSKEYYYRGVSDGGEYYLVIRSNGDKHVYANGYEYLYGATAYDRESFTFFSSDMILTEMNLAANPYVYDIFGGAGKAYNLAKFKKYPGGVSQYRASGADLNSLLVPDTAVVDMWISSKGVVTRFRITDGKNVIVNVRYTKVGETDSPALPSDVELSKVCAHNFVWTPDEDGTHKGVCTYDESHIVTGLSCYGGVATCVSGRKCDLCGGEYGDIDPDSHDFEWKSNGDDTHTEVCKRNEEHKGRTESCWDFTEATCVEKATCKVCGGESGEIAPENHDYKWVANGDGTHTQICTRDEKHIDLTENCSGGKATCTEQATCEVCGEKYGEPLGHKLPEKWTKGEGDKHIKRCLNEGCSYYEEEACSGGEAICIGKAICDVCGGEYGEIDENNHYYEWVSNGDGTHTEVCKRNREHKGKTEECRGGKATCTEKAVCEVCGEKYGEPLGHDFSVWVEVDKDYHKKVCSHDEKHVYQTQKHNFGKWTSDGNGKHYRFCETCNRREEAACNFSEPTCTEKAKCGVCGAEKGEPKGHLYGDFVSNGDGTHKKVCSACGDEIKGKCTGGKATCVEKAKCDVCHGEYGEFDTNNHDLQTVQNVGENTHTTTCKRTGCTYSVTENCSGGKATCTEKATCKVCGGKYGEVDLTNHAYKWKSNGDGTHTEVCSRDESHKGRTENCSGGTANCVEKATCKVCGDKYGEIDANNHDLKTEQNADGKTHTTACGRKGCTYSKTENCSGGEATCTEKAICEVCGKKYGEALLKYEESGDGYILAGVTETGKTKLTENDLIVIANEYEGKKIIGISAEAMGDMVANAKFAGISFENDNIETLDAGLFKEFIKGLADKEIKGLKLEKGIYLIGKVDGENFEAKWAIGSKGAEATLPENVNIAKGLFGNDAEITTVTVGKGVKLYDGILTEFGGNTLKIDFGNAFFNGKTTAALFNGSIYSSSMPYAEVVGDGDETYYVPMSLENAVVLNENVPAGAFRNMSMLKTVDLQNVKEIGERAFMGCSGITSVTLSENLEKINAYAFYGSSAITEITIPKSVKKVGTYAFGECGEITVTVEYDKGTDKRYNAIEASAFYKSVVTVKFGGTEAEWKGFVKADWNYSGEATVEYAA